MEENEMKASAYTENNRRPDAPPAAQMNNSDGLAAGQRVPPEPLTAQRPASSSSDESANKLVLTSKVNRRKTNLGRENTKGSPNRGGSDLAPANMPRQKTFAPGQNAKVHQVKRAGWANDDDGESELL